jgi:KEOPS complex subunit Pcc1
VPPHAADLRFTYASPDDAELVERAIHQEVGEIEGDRTSATVDREAETVVVRVTADDLVALRAGLNTWGSLVEVAEATAGA